MSDDATELRIAIGRVLERWQVEMIEAEACEQYDLAALLASHIADVKRALTSRAELGAFVAEAERAARMVNAPRGADRIGATLRWVAARNQEARALLAAIKDSPDDY